MRFSFFNNESRNIRERKKRISEVSTSKIRGTGHSYPETSHRVDLCNNKNSSDDNDVMISYCLPMYMVVTFMLQKVNQQYTSYNNISERQGGVSTMGFGRIFVLILYP
jgi:hypothetical protein